MIRRTIAAVAVFALTSSAFAADAYVLRFRAGTMTNACTEAFWADQLILHNPTDAPATVRLVDSSYPVTQSDGRELVIPARGTTAFRSFSGGANRWDRAFEPGTGHFIGVLHFQLPEHVQVTSRTIPGVVTCTGACLCPPSMSVYGAVPHRVYRAPVPAGTPHIHMGSDIPGTGTRTNVQIYNAGSADAVATVEVLQTCNDTVLDARTVSVPARSLLTVGALRSTRNLAVGCGATDNVSFVRVVATQPAMSWTTTIANGVTIPRVELTSSCD